MRIYRSFDVYCPFQFEKNIRKAAKQLVNLPPKTLPKPQLHPHPQHPFLVVKLKHVDQKLTEMKPQPQCETPEPPASPPSCRSAICFMTRVLHRLKEVDEHISEVNTLFFPCLFSALFSSYGAACFKSPKGP